MPPPTITSPIHTTQEHSRNPRTVPHDPAVNHGPISTRFHHNPKHDEDGVMCDDIHAGK